MSTTVIDDPSYLEAAEPQRLAAVSPLVKLLLIFGFLWGIIIGIIGQFVFRGMLEQELLRHQTLSIEFSQQFILIELISHSIALIAALVAMAFVWKAPSRKIAILTSMAAALVFALTCHMLSLGSVNGAIYSRDLWIFLYQNFAADDRPYLMLLSHGVLRTSQEGMAFGMLWLLLSTGIGAIAGFFFKLNPNQPTQPIKDAFGPVAALVLPAALLQSALMSLFTYPQISLAIDRVASELGQNREISTGLLMASAFLPPLLAGIFALLIAIYWAWTVDLSTVHRKILRLSQILMAVVGGIMSLSFVLALEPHLSSDIIILSSLIVVMALAWIYAVVLQIRLQGYVHKSGQLLRADNLSLAYAGIAALILGYLLLDFFGIRTQLNIVLYPIVFIPHGIQDTLDPSRLVGEILYGAISAYWLPFAQLMAVSFIIAMSVYQPIVWLANKMER